MQISKILKRYRVIIAVALVAGALYAVLPPSLILRADTGAPPSGDTLDTVSDLVDAGSYSQAETLLASFIATNARNTGPGASASYMLCNAYRMDAKLSDALAEAKTLQSAISGLTPTSDPNSDIPTTTEVDRFLDSLTAQIARAADAQKLADAETDPATQIADQGNVLLVSGDMFGARTKWIDAYNLLVKEPTASQTARLRVETDLLHMAPAAVNLKEVRQKQAACCLAILHDPAAGPARTALALSHLSNMIQGESRISVQSSFTDADRTFCWSAIDRIAASAPTSVHRAGPAGDVAELSSELAPLLSVQVTAQMGKAVGAEEDEQWRAALTLYRSSVDLLKLFAPFAPPPGPAGSGPTFLSAEMSEAERSISLMTEAASMPKDPDCAFLGVDHTSTSDWRGAVGNEAWVLFALQGTDECGGPAVLNGTFSYRTSIFDKANSVRRWRDSATYRKRTTDIALADPATNDSDAIAFIDDNGEQYPNFAGPDLSVDLTIPLGKHLLSLPLHFSDPGRPSAHYGIYLTENSGPERRLVLATVVSANDEPGFARISVIGPGRYTLMVRREDSLNANIQALFLDPDQRNTAPPALPNTFSAAEMAVIHGAKASETIDSLQGLPRIAALYEVGTSNPATVSWPELEVDAGILANSNALGHTERSIAAYIDWRAAERCPLQTAKIDEAFSRYLSERFAKPAAATAAKSP